MRLGWSWFSLLGGLAVVEAISLLTVGYFSGAMGPELLSPFNLLWLAYINLVLGLPWILGAAIGSVVVQSKRHLGADG
jgi:hypothetical protein